MMWASVDPGANGCIVTWQEDVPIHVFRLADLLGAKANMCRLALPQQLQIEYAVVEKVRGMRGDGAAQAFNFGWNCGIIHQYFPLCHYIGPVEWMGVMHKGLPKSMKTKLRSYKICDMLYKEFLNTHNAHCAADDGVWDALLLGRYWLWKQKKKSLAT